MATTHISIFLLLAVSVFSNININTTIFPPQSVNVAFLPNFFDTKVNGWFQFLETRYASLGIPLSSQSFFCGRSSQDQCQKLGLKSGSRFSVFSYDIEGDEIPTIYSAPHISKIPIFSPGYGTPGWLTVFDRVAKFTMFPYFTISDTDELSFSHDESTLPHGRIIGSVSKFSNLSSDILGESYVFVWFSDSSPPQDIIKYSKTHRGLMAIVWVQDQEIATSQFKVKGSTGLYRIETPSSDRNFILGNVTAATFVGNTVSDLKTYFISSFDSIPIFDRQFPIIEKKRYLLAFFYDLSTELSTLEANEYLPKFQSHCNDLSAFDIPCYRVLDSESFKGIGLNPILTTPTSVLFHVSDNSETIAYFPALDRSNFIPVAKKIVRHDRKAFSRHMIYSPTKNPKYITSKTLVKNDNQAAPNKAVFSLQAEITRLDDVFLRYSTIFYLFSVVGVMVGAGIVFIFLRYCRLISLKRRYKSQSKKLK